MICKFCNYNIVDNAKFCNHCGRKLNEPAAPAAPVRKVIKCANQLHFYDAAMYSTCPHCAAMNANARPAAASEKETVSVDEKKDKRPLFGFVKKSTSSDSSEKPVKRSGKKKSEVKAAEPSPEPARVAEAKTTEPSLTDNEYNETPKKRYSPKNNDSDKTIAIYDDLGCESPVVGWLVCIKGNNFGSSFTLTAGKNRIGRAPSMDVALMNEDSVSRNVHAMIIFEPNKSQFILQPGEESGLTYLNEEIVLGHQKLEAYDKILLGQCELLFIPICGERFTWENYQNQD